MTYIHDLGPLPAPDMCHEKARDDRDEETSYSAEAMEAERQRCYALGVAAERERCYRIGVEAERENICQIIRQELERFELVDRKDPR